MTTILDLNEPITTRSGAAVQILAAGENLLGGGSIVALVDTNQGSKAVLTYLDTGHYVVGEETDLDLINPPQQVPVRVNVGFDGQIFVYETEEEALDDAVTNIFAMANLPAKLKLSN